MVSFSDFSGEGSERGVVSVGVVSSMVGQASTSYPLKMTPKSTASHR